MRFTRLPFRSSFSGKPIDRVPTRQEISVFPVVALGRSNEADSAVTMHGVVPGHKIPHPDTCIIHAGKSIVRPLRVVLERSEQ
jgi:hypothetical protein